MRSKMAKWLSAIVVLVMLAVAVPQTVSAEELPTVVITEDTVLTADLNAHVVIGADGITLDGAGHRIIGDGTGVGINLTGRNRVTVTNCEVIGFFDGILLNSSHRNFIANNTVSGWLWEGVHLSYSDHNILTGNMACSSLPWDSDCGFWLSFSDNNILTKNTADGRWDTGFYLEDSSHNNSLRENMAIFNGWEYNGNGFALGGSHNKVTNNTASGSFYSGFMLWGIDDVIRNNTACGCGDGFYGEGNLRGNTACHNSIGFEVRGDLSQNLAIYNSVGFRVREGTYIGNTANYNNKGFYLAYYCMYNILMRNNASNNYYGFYLRADACFNTFIKNTALGNAVLDLGYRPVGAYEEIYGNVFVKNVFGKAEYPPSSTLEKEKGV